MVKVIFSPWCGWCKEVTEAIVYNLLKGKHIDIVDPMSVDTRLGYYEREDISSEPTIIFSKDRTYFKSLLQKGIMRIY